MSAFIAESTWVNRAHYEGAWDAYQVFKATGKTVQVSTTGLLSYGSIDLNSDYPYGWMVF